MSKEKESAASVECTVARGRTVVVPHATETVTYFRTALDGQYVEVIAPRQVEHGPGAKIRLTPAEHASLLAQGFLQQEDLAS